ncbi:MAG: methyltransferase [Alphaproteobacteria bacterium]|nr:methyltransferase [Alphaproteobacteria bacterium]
MLETTTDKFLNGRVLLRQPRRGYRAAIDPVLLAAAVPARRGEHVLDLGCGAGAAMFCLAARVSGLTITGVELQEDYLSLAQAGARLNAALGAFELFSGDVTRPSRNLPANSFHHVMMNPPYFETGKYDAGPSVHKSQAQAMANDQLVLWTKSAYGRLRDKGTLTVIYPVDGFADLLNVMGGKFGALTVFPLWPKSGAAAKRVLVQGKKGSKAPLKLLSGMILHEDGGYTAQANALLRDAHALIMS